MASKQGSSSIVGLRDVAFLIAAFEQVNSCSLSVGLALKRGGKPGELEVAVTAYTWPDADADPAVLAFVNRSVAQLGVVTMEGAIIHSLYLMDAELARIEMQAPQPK